MSRAEQIRGKFFGKDKTTTEPKANDPDASLSRSSSDVPLTIQIPKQTPPTPPPAPPKLRESKPDSSPKPEQDSRSFRERLVERLAHDYHGAERYRLVQDDNKELHWKRWGPYVSDRQWVSL